MSWFEGSRNPPGEARRGRRALLSDGGAPLRPLEPGWKGGAVCSKGPRELDGPLWEMWDDRGPRMFGPPNDELVGRCSDSSGGGLVLGHEPSKGIMATTRTKEWICDVVYCASISSHNLCVNNDDSIESVGSPPTIMANQPCCDYKFYLYWWQKTFAGNSQVW